MKKPEIAALNKGDLLDVRFSGPCAFVADMEDGLALVEDEGTGAHFVLPGDWIAGTVARAPGEPAAVFSENSVSLPVPAAVLDSIKPGDSVVLHSGVRSVTLLAAPLAVVDPTPADPAPVPADPVIVKGGV